MASALLHMSCPTLKNDIIGMDSGSLNDALHGLERGKRDHDIDDLDRCQVKKRRKQSKPNRIASSESFGDGNVKSSDWVDLQHQQTLPQKETDESITSKDGEFSETPNENTKGEHGNYSDADESIEGNYSGVYSSNLKKEFSFPLNLSHKTPSPQDSTDSFSSTLDERGWYKSHENASLLYNTHNSDPMNLKTQPYQSTLFQSSQACNVILPSFKRILVGNNESQIGSPHRIFNPEAFCDLCNKEFCNKYFLKTHKANKHGIYMENIGPNPMENLPTLPLMNYFSTSIANLSLSSNQPSKKINNSSFSTSFNKSNSSLRAFCNICQREFCNKYFVRRHKAKIHGIVESSSDQDVKQISHDKTELESNLPGPSTLKLNKDLSNTPTEDEKTTVKKEDVELEETDSPHDALSLLVSSWQTEEIKDCSKSPERSKKFPNSSSSAFCDICCKEYCNKYFLRVHKQKCHGIPIPEKDEKGKEVASKANQPMPLNLILRENNKNTIDIESNIICNLCNMHFTDSYSLKIHHEKVHKNELVIHKNEQVVEKVSQSITSKTIYSPVENLSNKQNLDFSNQKQAEITNHSLNQQENVGIPKKNQSPDIQKMNTMLLKLNQHIPFENYMCDVCNIDYGSIASLENHIIRDHATLIEEISNSFYEENQNHQHSQFNKLECTRCQKQFTSINLLEQHFTEKHSLSESKANNKILNDNQDVNSQSASSERQVMHTPTSSFCEICKKELCNKYFMKTHMQRMHGISIENGAHIGGVVCDICNKELCSKYFLRVHKQNSHGIVEEAFLPQIGSDIKVPISNSDIALRPNDNELSHRYFSHFTEVCSICNRRFRSAKWLRAHLLNDHGDEGKDKWREVQQQNGNKIDRTMNDSNKKIEQYYNQSYKNYIQETPINDGPSTSDPSNDMIPSFLNRATPKQYQCTYCPFSSTVLALLLVHERTHLPSAPDAQDLRCPICSLLCENNESLEKHLVLKHNSAQFVLKKTPDEINQLNDNAQMYQCEDIENRRIQSAKEDNNFDEMDDTKTGPSSDPSLKCNQCLFVTSDIEIYSEHMKNEHKSEEPQIDYLQIIRDALLQIANNSHIPASFAVPNSLGNFMMQPFVLEDKAYGANSPSTFLSSLVFLPVKERLNKPITASFKLTPT